MAASNLCPLRQNVLEGLPCEISRKAFLWLAQHHDSTRMKFRAEQLAHEVAGLIQVVRPMVAASRPLGTSLEDEIVDDLMAFILKRWIGYKLGPNLRGWWEGG